MGVDEFQLSPEVCFALGKGPGMWCTGLWVAWSPKLQLQESERQSFSPPCNQQSQIKTMLL